MFIAKKAIVLAAGFGTRLKPLTCAVPKPLMPVWGEPMLSRIVSMLRAWGVEDIVVNCHYLHEQVEAWCAANGCRAQYEPEILGTGGVLNPLRNWIGQDDFYLVNGDIVVEGFGGFATDALREKSIIATALVTEEGPRTIEVEPTSHYVTNWKSDDAGWDGTYTYCGVTLLKADILRYVEPTGFSTIVAAYEKAMADGLFVKAEQKPGLLWTDAGTIARYIDLNQTEEDNAFADIPQIKAVSSAEKVTFLGARGSNRVFFKAEDRVIIVYDDVERPENGLYASHARWLRAQGIPVPEVLADVPEMKTLALSWGGSDRKMTLEEYVHVVEALVAFNGLDATSLTLQPPFDAALWRWERELFETHCLKGRFGRDMTKAVRQELERVAAVMEKEPKALVHRDFQSTNILWKSGHFTFIDFQGMRLGPAAYDLASLVYDPYVTFTEGERRALVALYAKKAGRPEMPNILPFAAVQRLSQCLGAYGRLASVGQPQFEKYVMPALENLLAAADEAGLDAIGALAEDLIAEERNRHERAHAEHDSACSCGHHHHEA